MFEIIKTQLGKSVPFAIHTGVELIDLSSVQAVARLAQRPEVSNHIGTVHAGALFTLAEAASGAAMAGIFAEQIHVIRSVVSDAHIKYIKPSRGVVTATGKPSLPVGAIQAELAATARVVFDIQVEIEDESGANVATFVATWNVKKV